MDKDKIIDSLAQWVDDKVDFKQLIGGVTGLVAEKADGWLFGVGIRYGFDKIPNEYKDEALLVMDAVVTGRYDVIANEAIDELVSRVNLGIGDRKERIIFGGIWNIVSELMKDETMRTLDGGNVEPGQGTTEKDPD